MLWEATGSISSEIMSGVFGKETGQENCYCCVSREELEQSELAEDSMIRECLLGLPRSLVRSLRFIRLGLRY
jgi:hypothetical protein